jgi:hypothetical protein
MEALSEWGQQLATQLSALVCHCKSKAPQQALLALLAAFGLGALCGFLASSSSSSSGGKRRQRQQRQQEEEEEEDSDDDEEESEEEGPAGGSGAIRDFSLLSAPFKMVLCVNMELNMGKGGLPGKKAIVVRLLLGVYAHGLGVRGFPVGQGLKLESSSSNQERLVDRSHPDRPTNGSTDHPTNEIHNDPPNPTKNCFHKPPKSTHLHTYLNTNNINAPLPPTKTNQTHREDCGAVRARDARGLQAREQIRAIHAVRVGDDRSGESVPQGVFKWVGGWMDGWMDGVGGWMDEEGGGWMDRLGGKGGWMWLQPCCDATHDAPTLASAAFVMRYT